MTTLSAISQSGLNSAITLSGCSLQQNADNDPVLETIAGVSTGDYVFSSTNANSTNTADVPLAWPADFDNPSSATSLSVRLQYALQTGTRVNTWTSLEATLVDSGGSALSNTVSLATNITTTTPTNTSVVSFTGLNTTAGQSVWLGAQLRISISISKSMGGDTLEKQVFAGEVTGDYTPKVSQNLTLTGDPAGSYSLTGGSATLSKDKSLTGNAGTYSLIGESASLSIGFGLIGNAATYTLTGGSADLAKGKVLTGNAGSYSLTGGDSDLSWGHALTGNVGTYALTGGSADLTFVPAAINYTLDGNAGSYTTTGGDADLAKSKLLQANAGSYSLTGGSAYLSFSTTLTANAGSYSLTGGDAILFKGKVLQGAAGTYTFTGFTADLIATRTLTGQAGSYTVTGGDAVLFKGKVLQGSAGSYTVTGGDANLTAVIAQNLVLTASPGSYLITGGNALIQIGGQTQPSGGKKLKDEVFVWADPIAFDDNAARRMKRKRNDIVFFSVY